MKSLNIIFVVVLALLLIGDAIAAPFLQRIYTVNGFSGGYGSPHDSYGNRHQTTRRLVTQKPRGRSYKEICRAVNPAPFAYPNKIPYPSVPIC